MSVAIATRKTGFDGYLNVKYYQIFADVDRPDRWWLGIPRDTSGREVNVWDFLRGEELRINNLQIPIDEEGEELDITWAPFDIPIVSQKCGEIIRSVAPQSVQLIPASLPNARQVLVVNILSIVDCLDYERSSLSVYPSDYYRKDLVGKPQAVLRLMIRPDKTQGMHLFRVANYKTALVASDRLLGALAEARCTGYVVLSEVTP